MDGITILRLGAVMLAFGSLGLFIVRSTNQRLRGLGWLGVAFSTGFLGALLLVIHAPRTLSVLGSDFCVLLSFALLQTAIMDLMTQRPRIEWSNVAMFSLLILVDVQRLRGLVGPDVRVATVSALVALQCGLSAATLWRTARPAERVPAWFCMIVLGVFALYNVARGVVSLLGYPAQSPMWHNFVETGGYALYIAVALGLAFGFFWMSTAQLSVQLEYIAGTDPLTRLYNRRTFVRACEKEMLVSQQKGRRFSVLMVDLDYFKKINDRFGHQVGDEALVAAVESMQNATRGSDVLARWGGEEFAALLPNATLEAAMIVAERIRQNVERVRLQVNRDGVETVLRMTASIGVATFGEKDTLQSLMARSDRGLYLAKNGGRNQAVSVQADTMPPEKIAGGAAEASSAVA
jgi:diguanylate cyclase (GGDEF)-like protein